MREIPANREPSQSVIIGLYVGAFENENLRGQKMTHFENSTNQIVVAMSGAVQYDAYIRFMVIERNKSLNVKKIVHMGDPNNRRSAAAQWFKSRNSR